MIIVDRKLTYSLLRKMNMRTVFFWRGGGGPGLTWTEDGMIDMMVHRKATHADQYLNVYSHHMDMKDQNLGHTCQAIT